MKTLERLGTQNIRQLLWEFSVPAVVSTVANALYTVVNRLCIGQGCGRDAIAGVALAFPFLKWSATTQAATVEIAALGIANSVLFLMLMPVFGITQGMQPIIGYNAGA